jgi:hypothetical protein
MSASSVAITVDCMMVNKCEVVAVLEVAFYLITIFKPFHSQKCILSDFGDLFTNVGRQRLGGKSNSAAKGLLKPEWCRRSILDPRVVWIVRRIFLSLCCYSKVIRVHCFEGKFGIPGFLGDINPSIYNFVDTKVYP